MCLDDNKAQNDTVDNSKGYIAALFLSTVSQVIAQKKDKVTLGPKVFASGENH